MGAWTVIFGIYGGGLNLPNPLDKEGLGFTAFETAAFTFSDGRMEFTFAPGKSEFTFREDDPA